MRGCPSCGGGSCVAQLDKYQCLECGKTFPWTDIPDSSRQQPEKPKRQRAKKAAE